MRIWGGFLIATIATLLAGCGYSPEQRATSGAAIGGATGLALGAAAGNSPGAALAGGVLGAAAGAVIGANTRPAAPPPPPPGNYPPPPRCAHWGYDGYGRPVCVAWYGY
ncbi:MAG: hypothetical protein EPN75_02285 [Beijerinckiaceae bacterium]|nr:MAG: hypothetical protein EPN75_02285 [Beijerinckiaceae bacterium]